eukprot:CAMPEP_0181454468 /NCGR_PEP_ID=MMETSP1110-20121109/30252_1 /TAXON_ID=174948 /ORGANISM="Symbiodinium sp., Strain CCMP421" /LENGTH=70 /DNA_ID=CAMNT_0023578811 /DNA_START=166 /DNA_END=378 /DNA_ORIENTATION=-
MSFFRSLFFVLSLLLLSAAQDTGTGLVDASDPCASRGGRLLTVASVGFIAGGALTVRDRDPLASALLSAI